jgi:hypothetical protein
MLIQFTKYQKEAVMFSKAVVRGSIGKLHKTLMVLFVLAVLFATLPVGRAYAWTITSSVGNPPVPSIEQINITSGGNSAGQVVTSVHSYGPYMESNNLAWGNHNVSVYYQLEHYALGSNGSYSWKVIAITNHIVPISLGTGPMVRLPYVNFHISAYSTGYFRITYKIFRINSSGFAFAYTEIVPNNASDFQCHSYLLLGRPCQTAPGWFRLGRYGATGF